MNPLQQLLSTISGETQQANNVAPAPWQQELLETVSPEKVQRRRIAQALAQASQNLATTPGNFLSGVAAASSAGANNYIQSGEQADIDRVKALHSVNEAQRRDGDDRLKRLHDLYTVQSGNENTQYNRGRDNENTQYNRGRDKELDADRLSERKETREARLQDRADNREARITESQANRQQRILEGSRREFADWRERYMSENLGDLPPAEVEQQVRDEINKAWNLSNNDTGGGILEQPPAPDQRVVGQIYQTPKGPHIWTGNGWKPAQ